MGGDRGRCLTSRRRGPRPAVPPWRGTGPRPAMRLRVPARIAQAALALLTATGCVLWTPPPPPEPPPPPAPELPPLPVEQITIQPLPDPVPLDLDPLAGHPPGDMVTLSAIDVDVRALLPVLAEAAGLSLVLDPEVEGRVSVNLVDVPALEALRMVLQQADLSIASPPLTAPWGPVVFYVLPVDVRVADAELIQRRFLVSPEMAQWIVEIRILYP